MVAIQPLLSVCRMSGHGWYRSFTWLPDIHPLTSDNGLEHEPVPAQTRDKYWLQFARLDSWHDVDSFYADQSSLCSAQLNGQSDWRDIKEASNALEGTFMWTKTREEIRGLGILWLPSGSTTPQFIVPGIASHEQVQHLEEHSTLNPIVLY